MNSIPIEDTEAFAIARGESAKTIQFLQDELGYISKALKSAPDDDTFSGQYRQRVVFKLYTAFVEGATSQLQNTLLSIEENVLLSYFTVEEYLAIRGEVPFIKDNGKVITKRSNDPIRPRVALIFNSFAKVLAPDFELNKNGRWEELGLAFRTRNRITHPSDKLGLLITQDEYKELTVAGTWFDRELKSLFASFKETDFYQSTLD